MKAKYVGLPVKGEDADPPRRVEFAGKVFRRGQFVDVSDVRETLQAKLRGNPAFVVSDDPMTEAELAAASAESDERDPLDHDGDGKKGGSLTKAQICAKLDELKVDYNPQAKRDELAAVLEGALFEKGE